MARSFIVGLALCGLLLAVNSADARHRRRGGCSSCGTVTTGCAGGSCAVPPASATADAPAVAKTEEAKPEVVTEAAPATTTTRTVATNNGRNLFRGRLFSRR